MCLCFLSLLTARASKLANGGIYKTMRQNKKTQTEFLRFLTGPANAPKGWGTLLAATRGKAKELAPFSHFPDPAPGRASDYQVLQNQGFTGGVAPCHRGKNASKSRDLATAGPAESTLSFSKIKKFLTYPLFASTVGGSEGILAIFPSDGTSAGSWARKSRN